MARVLIADPSPFFCEAMAMTLASDPAIEVVGWAVDEPTASRLATERSADLLLTEIELARGTGLGLVRRLRERVRCVVLTRTHEADLLLEAVTGGAVGWLRHDIDAARLTALLTQAGPGEFLLDRDRSLELLRRAVEGRDGDRRAPASLAGLTARELEVVRLLAMGLDDRAIAARLFVSAHTVRTHVGNALRKLGVHSRADAARLVLEGDEASRGEVLHIEGPTWQTP